MQNALVPFAEALQSFSYPSSKGSPAPIHDPSKGLAAKFAAVCEAQWKELQDEESRGMDADITGGPASSSGTRNAIDFWKLEQKTWLLVSSIYRIRSDASFAGPSIKEIVHKNPYTPEKSLILAMIRSSPLLAELVTARTWLHRTAPPPLPAESRDKFLRFTKLSLVQQLRQNPNPNAPAGGPSQLVRELDPDAPTRTGGVWDARDAEYDAVLARSLFSYVRAGNTDEAIRICGEVDMPFRAAVMRGAYPFEWDEISGNPQPPKGKVNEEDTPWHDNRRRKLWRKMCSAVASNPTVPSSQRLLLASLSPSFTHNTVPTLLPALTEWPDHLWARISAFIEDRIEENLDKAAGWFWGGGKDNRVEGTRMEEDDGEELWKRKVMLELDGMKDIKLPNSSPDASNPYIYAQLRILQNFTEEMLREVASVLESKEDSDYTTRMWIRFLAHLVLFLRLAGASVPGEAADALLRSYIGVLEAERQTDLVALYVGALADNAVERYAAFLASLDLNTSIDDRHDALNRAQEHGLDVEGVAFHAATLSAAKEFRSLPPFSPVLPDIEDFIEPISTQERGLIRSVEWLTFYSPNFPDALRQANAILRYLFCFGRLTAARAMLESLPHNLLAHTKALHAEGTEYVHFQAFFAVWDEWDEVAEVRAAEVPIVGQQGVAKAKQEAVEWKKRYTNTLESAREKTLQLLGGEWMRPFDREQITEDEIESEEATEKRNAELVRIRQIFIPILVMRLHHELFISRTHFPPNSKLVLDLSTVVADGRHKLYEDFARPEGQQSKLVDYLKAVRAAGLAVLDGGGADPFR